MPKSIINQEILKQLVRSSSSIGANYIEANEALSKKDFLMRIKISRKEAKETAYWLKLIDFQKKDNNKKYFSLIEEGTHLTKILSAIALKVE